MSYAAVNLPVLVEIPPSASSVLDIGCGTGALGRELKRARSVWVTGLTASQEEADIARHELDEALVEDVETWNVSSVRRRYDVVVCSHVLEHLRDPVEVLSRLRAALVDGGTLIIALPNVLHWRQRLTFLRGTFRYTPGGIMDRTHLRFYDWEGARTLLSGPDWEIARSYAVGHAPGVWRVPRLGALLDRLVCRLRPGLFGDQFIIVARAR